ncbi:MAG: 4-(cytidine 5'-diphospho)-2-C-methyl-D-erythritol kinase [Deltaproteobacteria bacterium]
MTASDGFSFLAPAKLNLSLRVYGKRPDGFHSIRSVMVPVTLYDEVAVEEAEEGIEVVSDDPTLPTGKENSCYRAAARFLAWAGVRRGVRIRIRKRIPVEAGLGGGSSDAAAVFKGLSALTGRLPPPATLREMAAGVGADVPFFTLGVPALVEGIGDRLTPVEWRVPLFALIVKPRFGLPTGEGYARLNRPFGGPPAEEPVPSFSGWADVISAVGNDFEECWDPVRPELREIREELRAAGAEAACLTGSGSAVFGLFAGESDARRAEERLARGDGRCLFLVRNIHGGSGRGKRCG